MLDARVRALTCGPANLVLKVSIVLRCRFGSAFLNERLGSLAENIVVSHIPQSQVP